MKTKNLMNAFKIGVLAFAVTLGSCSKDEPNQADTNSSKVVKKYLMGQSIMLVPDGEDHFLHGDMRVHKSQLGKPFDNTLPPGSPKNKLAVANRKKWTNGVVIYQYGSGLSSKLKDNVKKAMDHWSSKTNITFKKRTNESDYVTINNMGNAQCNCGVADLGLQVSGKGELLLGTAATVDAVVHEFGHTLGFIHEQNRSDRDQYIKINWENIIDNFESQFAKSENATLLTRKFDMNSTMMYHSEAFSKNDKPTMVDLNGNTFRGGAFLTQLDIEGTNIAYPKGADETNNPCENVEAWQSGKQYFEGDKVIYEGYQFTVVSLTWVRGPKCK